MAGDPRPKMVLVGAGFTGLREERTFDRASVDVCGEDRNDYHTFLQLSLNEPLKNGG